MTIYTLFHLGEALAPNIQTLLVTRFLSGFFAVAPLTIFGGKQVSGLYKLYRQIINFGQVSLQMFGPLLDEDLQLVSFRPVYFSAQCWDPSSPDCPLLLIASQLYMANITWSLVSSIAQSLGDGYFG